MFFENAYRTVSDLVQDFKDNENYYLNHSYSEADVRNDFINKFFIALGWDVRHEEQKNPYEQEVKVEKPLQFAKAQKRADYSFSIAPDFRTVKFFVEAKKPAHDLENKVLLLSNSTLRLECRSSDSSAYRLRRIPYC